jgi:hypothetical protein
LINKDTKLKQVVKKESPDDSLLLALVEEESENSVSIDIKKNDKNGEMT